MQEIDNLDLFVVGEDSPDPGDWSIWSEYALVVARDQKEAIRLAGDEYTVACKIEMDKPQILILLWGAFTLQVPHP